MSSASLAPDVSSLAAETAPEEWQYLNEGGANVVYASRDPLHPTYGRKALRVPKAATTKESGISQQRQREAQQVFEESVLPALIDEEYLVKRSKVVLPSRWLRRLEEATEDARPSHRRHAQRSPTGDEADSSDVTAELLDNLIGGQGVLAVEIKPKWGFLPNPEYLSQASRLIKTRHCRFCMHRHLRAKALEGDDISLAESSIASQAEARPREPVRDDEDGYCPLDLFSGRPERVAKAVDALWQGYLDTDGLGNNLRLYLDGTQVPPRSEPPKSNDVKADIIKDALVETFTASPVLRRLGMVQQGLDPLDVEGVMSKLLEVPSAAERPSATSETSSLDRWLEEPAPVELAALVKTLQSPTRSTGCEQWTTREYFLAYLLSTTFKDCSLIIRFDARAGSSLERTAIKLIDLDLKSLSKFSRWAELDRQIWTTYAERVRYNGERRTCTSPFLHE